MQIIAHVTDQMKHDLKPQKPGTTTTTIRPTPSHKPGLYAPSIPPGPQSYFAEKNLFEEYVQKLQNPEGLSYLDRYALVGEGDRGKAIKSEEDSNQLPNDLDLFGDEYTKLVKFINQIDRNDFRDDETRVEGFLKDLDDSSFGRELLKQKRIPPTRAYVTLLSLYDQLSKEAKKLMLNKYGVSFSFPIFDRIFILRFFLFSFWQGYAENVLNILIDSSGGTSAEQLNIVLSKIVERRDITNENVLKKIHPLLFDLKKADSYLNDALRYIPPLQFAP